MSQDPDDLRRLAKRLDDAQAKHTVRISRPAPTQMGIAGRFATEFMASLVVGAALGWGLDWVFGHFGVHTKPVFLIAMFVLGAVAGIRNVMRAATEINARMASQPGQAAPAQDDEET